MAYFRSSIFYIGYIGSGILASLLACLFGPFMSLKNRLKFFSIWPKFANWFLYVTCNIKLVVQGQENIPTKPCVIVSNHQGQWETFSMQYLFHPLCTLLKRELLYIPFWGWAMSLLDPIAINRSKPKEAIVQTLREGSNRLKSGLFVLLFPEGPRVEAGKVGTYARSSFELAKMNNVQVLPICHNSGDCSPAHKFIKHSGVIKLTIGSPINVVDSRKSADEVRAWTEKKLNS